jgi:hypothetical protein
MELCVASGPAKGHRRLGADRAGGSCGPAKGRDGAAARAELLSVSSSPTMEFHVIDGLVRGHRSLGADRVGGSCGLARGARWGSGWPRGTVDYELGGGAGEANGQRKSPQQDKVRGEWTRGCASWAVGLVPRPATTIGHPDPSIIPFLNYIGSQISITLTISFRKYMLTPTPPPS